MRSGVGSLRGRLFWAFALVTVIAATLPALIFRNALYEERVALAGNQALAQAALTGSLLNARPDEEHLGKIFAAAKAQSLRMTLVDASGRVLRDSHIEESALPDLGNHQDRPEIESAAAAGSGVSLRHSNSLGLDAVYAAVSLQNGDLLRVAVPLTVVQSNVRAIFSALIPAVLGAVGLCLLLSFFITSRVRRGVDSMTEVVDSISRSKTRSRLRDVPGREFLPLARAVNLMADTIEEYTRTTNDQRRQLETILDSMSEGVLVLDPAGKIRRWNKALAALFPAVAAAQDKPLIEGLPFPVLQRRVDALFAPEAQTRETAAQKAPIHFEAPGGRFLVAHCSLPAERDAFLGAVIVICDATEITRLERVRRDFVSNVSHELRTPLTAVVGYAETLMSSDDLQAEYRNFAGVIHKHAVTLDRLVRDLLALARLENAGEAVTLTPVDAAGAVKEALSACREQADAKNIRFAVNLEDTRVQANTPLLTQVFRNLLENACRYSPAGDVISIRAQRREKQVLFTVADNGPGIPREELPRIFERFYQVKKERNSGASGIGLAFCKHVVERHGGRIWAESPHGKATTAMLFTLSAAE